MHSPPLCSHSAHRSHMFISTTKLGLKSETVSKLVLCLHYQVQHQVPGRYSINSYYEFSYHKMLLVSKNICKYFLITFILLYFTTGFMKLIKNPPLVPEITDGSCHGVEQPQSFSKNQKPGREALHPDSVSSNPLYLLLSHPGRVANLIVGKKV